MSVRHKNSSDVRTSARNGRFSATLYSGIYWLHPELGRWNKSYRKIPKVSPGTYIFERPFLRGLSMEGNLRFKIDSGSPLVGTKSTVFAWGQFPNTSPPPGRGLTFAGTRGNGGFLALRVWGAYIHGELIFGILRYAFAVPQAIQFPLASVRVSNSFLDDRL